MKWFIYFKYPIPFTQKTHGSSSYGFSTSYEYAEESRIIDEHPLKWIKQNKDITLISWKKLEEEDIAALQE